ncbi:MULTISPECIES: hypothetical protein [unclassified Neisseria]|uniref:hypothetical protein n=1 Tax=unclassified Neisseria TaxID=2623750 RepID=UPI0026670B75|nr:MULTISPECIES: hypothetical protein [unclassified Neisseria]MDO1510969.1 hypothetical protein [Neisseria sp. MVDL19-042950]MDO1517228.1 hypothetical protein [Neisseria sp. MVDL18-041461]MDO1564591.1 hypothetical protein [Neisseria sp. MVDL20-010259]
MKKLIILTLLAVSPFAFADNAADELLSAQAAYRDALKAQSTGSNRIAALQSELSAAQARLKQAQADVVGLQEKLREETAAQTQADSTLQAASKRLDAAWKAARSTSK